jgi:hypothetical protein
MKHIYWAFMKQRVGQNVKINLLLHVHVVDHTINLITKFIQRLPSLQISTQCMEDLRAAYL